MRPEPLYRYSLVAIVFLLPAYLVRCDVLGIPTNLLELAIGIVTLTGLCQRQVRTAAVEALRLLPSAFVISGLLFLLAAGISIFVSPHIYTSLGILKGWILVPLIYAVQVFAVSTCFPEFKTQIIKALIVTGVFVSMIGISQLGTLDRVRGVYDVPNSLALFIAPLVVLARIQKIEMREWKIGYWLAGVMFLALLGTQSAAGVLSVALVLGVHYVLRWRTYTASITKYHFFFAILAIGATIVFTAPKITYLLSPGSSAYVRVQLWDISWELIKSHPLTGIGLGAFEPAYQEQLHQRFLKPAEHRLEPLREFVFRDPHNWIFSLWLNTGLLGLLSFIGIHSSAFLQEKRITPTAWALLTLLIFGLVDTIFWKNDLAALQFLFIFLSISPTAVERLRGSN